jgi:hypothetical protein
MAARFRSGGALRALWRRVHPDLFQQHPVAADANQRAMQELGAFLDQAAERHDALLAGMNSALPPAPHSRLLTFFVDVPAPAAPCEVRVRISPPRVPGHLSPQLAARSWDEGMQRCIADAVTALDCGGAPGDESAGLGDSEAAKCGGVRQPDIATSSPLFAAARRSPRSRAATQPRPGMSPRPPQAVLTLSTKRLFFGHGLTPEDESSIIQRLERLLPQLSQSLVADLVESMGPARGVSDRAGHTYARPLHPPIVVGIARSVSEENEGSGRVVRLELNFDRSQLEQAFRLAIRTRPVPSPTPDPGPAPASQPAGSGSVNGGGVNGVRSRSEAEDAVRTAERVRSILGCEGVLLTGVDAATALAASRALLADANRMRGVLDRKWAGLTLRIEPAGGVAGRSNASGRDDAPEASCARVPGEELPAGAWVAKAAQWPCLLVDGAGGGAQLLLSGKEGAAAAAAFARSRVRTLRLAQERFDLVDEMCTRLGCKAATPLGIGSASADSQVASLRTLIGQMRTRHVRLPPEVGAIHLIIGDAADAACARVDTTAARYVAMPNLFDLEELEAALRVQTAANTGARGPRARRRQHHG